MGNWEWGMGNWGMGNWGIAMGNGLLIEPSIQFPIPYAQFLMSNSYLALDSVRA